ncbi:MAG: halocyanin domain-containing protein [Halapricum sp.]
MSEPNVDSSRRNFLRAAAGTATVTAATGTAAAADGGSSGGGHPDYGNWLDGVGNYSGSTADKRGQKEVTISVGASGNGGNFAFDPPAVWVDPGTKVTWEWTGKGGDHNVVGDNVDFTSGSPTGEQGHTYSHTFEDSQIVDYYCHPHRSLGMKGAIAVGNDVPTVTPSTASGPLIPDSAKSLGIASGFAMITTLGLAYFFMKYGGDYRETEE